MSAAITTSASGATPTVIGTKLLGYSYHHRPIMAYHLGTPGKTRAVILGQIHGDEHAGVYVANDVIRGRRVLNLDLWVIPTVNPDGNIHNTRQSDHGVDLNRNWPNYWARITDRCYTGPNPLRYASGCNSGSYPLSEPETRAMYRFLVAFKPQLMVSIHQPLYGVDTTDGGARNPAFRDRLSRGLHLREKAFRCWSVCHGTMTGWITHYQSGSAITVEFGYSPSAATERAAASALIYAFGGRLG